MENNQTAEKTARLVIHTFEQYFGDKFENYTVFDLTDTPHVSFSIRFTAYAYFDLLFNYDKGNFNSCIETGGHKMIIATTRKWRDSADLTNYCQELQQAIEMQVPDRFLKHRGWK